MAKHTVNNTYNDSMDEITSDDRVEAAFVNKIIAQLLCNDAYNREQAKQKAAIEVVRGEMPTERAAGTWYMRVTDQQSVGVNDSIQVSPTMAIKVVS